jgi:hypothetical protein
MDFTFHFEFSYIKSKSDYGDYSVHSAIKRTTPLLNYNHQKYMQTFEYPLWQNYSGAPESIYLRRLL